MAADAEGLFAEHHQQLFRYLCRAVGQADTARDLTQDLFVRVSRAKLPDAGGPQIKAWLFRIARNLALDHHRRRVMRAEAQDVPEGQRPATQHTALAINRALESLADLDRDVFLMREVSGLTYDEIATACDLTTDSVRSRLHRTRLQLRQQLAAPIAQRLREPMRQRPGRPRQDL